MLRWPRHAGVRACAQQRSPHWKRRIVVGDAPESLKAKAHQNTRAGACGCVCAWFCVRAYLDVCMRVCVPSECENARVRALLCVRVCMRVCVRESALRE